MTRNAADMIQTRRKCGACDLCCTAPSLKSETVTKPTEARCPHLRGQPGKSCSIYKDRPVACAEYLCLWRASDTLLPEHLYPRDAGFVVSLSSWDWPFLVTVQRDPNRPDAWDTTENRAVFARLASTLNAIVVIGEADKACELFAPNGKTYSRAMYPQFFGADNTVGLPTTDFHAWPRDKVVLASLIFNPTETS